MIPDRIGRVFGTGRLNSLLLGMFAIFPGITASFALDEWREQRQTAAIGSPWASAA